MPQLEDHHRAMIERTLGRSLVEEELREAHDLGGLSATQLAVIDRLSRMQVIAYLSYLRAIVSRVTMAEATELMNRVQRERKHPCE